MGYDGSAAATESDFEGSITKKNIQDFTTFMGANFQHTYITENSKAVTSYHVHCISIQIVDKNFWKQINLTKFHSNWNR